MIPPNISAHEAEKTVIGVLLKRPETAPKIREVLSQDDFGDHVLRGIYIAAMNVYDETGTCDLVTVDHEYTRLHKGKSATADIIDACNTFYTSELVLNYCGYIVEASQRRNMFLIADELAGLARKPDTDVTEAIAGARRSLSGLLRSGGSIRSMGDVLLAAYEYTEKVAKGEIVPCTSGFSTLDEFMGGFYPSELTVIGARPGVGKTAAALMISTATARENKQVFFASAEMGDVQIGQRELADESNINTAKIRKPKTFTETDWLALSHALNERSKLSVSWSFERNIDRIISQARQQKDRDECDIFLVDYAQFLTSNRYFEADRLRVEYIAHELQAISRELKVPVITAAQLNRPMKGDRSVPGLESFADSSAIEKDADNAIILHKPQYSDDDIFKIFPEDVELFQSLAGTGKQLIYFNLVKQRQGPTAITAALYDGAHGRFLPVQR